MATKIYTCKVKIQKERGKKIRSSLSAEIPGGVDFIISVFIWVLKKNTPALEGLVNDGNKSFQYHPEAMFNAGSVQLFCKGPNSQYFRLCGPVISATSTQLCNHGAKAAPGSDYGSVPEKTL